MIINTKFSASMLMFSLLAFSSVGCSNSNEADLAGTSTVETMNVIPRAGFIPDVNMWCPHTTNPSPAIAVML